MLYSRGNVFGLVAETHRPLLIILLRLVGGYVEAS